MRIKTIRLVEFKRFDDLTIDLGDSPQKLVALVGPNGCGKSSIFDAFEQKMKTFRSYGNELPDYYSKSSFYADPAKEKTPYNIDRAIQITTAGNLTRKSFYIRTSYRFTAKLNVTQISTMQPILVTNDEPISTISLDTRLESNYRRMLAQSVLEFFQGDKTGNAVKKELIGKVNEILNRILDIEISDIGNVFENKGQLFFKKGNVTNFPYANLSSGEKEVVDIVIDLLIKTKEYTETVFCIDEPELHIHTAIQRKLLIEIEKLIPAECQLWIATHSLGFLRAIQDELNDQSQVLDFSASDYFTGVHVIYPIKMTRTNWKRIFSTALDDLIGLVSPKKIIYCEGKAEPSRNGEEAGLDAIVLNNIFSENYSDTVFVSSGGNTELDQRSEVAIIVLRKVLTDTEILVLKDRDISSGKITSEAQRQLYLKNNPDSHRVLKRWELENYLFDKEVLIKYTRENSLTFDEQSYDAKVKDIENQSIKDDIGFIKNMCGITTSISPKLFKTSLSKTITKDMRIYSELEQAIFLRV